MTATARRRSCGTRLSRTAVMMARVPSLPASNPPRSYPVLSFGIPGRRRRTVPSASTASKPTTCRRIGPWRRTFTPPALVATMPPIVAESRAPRSTPTSQPAARAAAWTAPRVAPAPTVISPASASTSPMDPSRRRLMTTSPPRGTEPPTRLVLPPCGTTPTPASAQARRQSPTSDALPGRTTASAGPLNRRVQSVSYDARMDGSVRRWRSPTIRRRFSSSSSSVTR